MMKMNKILKYFLFFAFMLILPISTEINAQDLKNNKIYLERADIPEEVYEYVKENYRSFIPFYLIEKDELDNLNLVIGEPYSIYDLNKGKLVTYRFPIFNNGKCITIADIDKDINGNYFYTCMDSPNGERKMIDELMQLEGIYRFETWQKNSYSAPKFYYKKIGEYGDRTTTTSELSNISKPFLTLKKEDLKEEIKEWKSIKSEKENRSPNYPYEKILPMHPKETQGSKPWCAAYVAARILSYKFEDDIRAINIMEWAYPVRFWGIFGRPNLDEKSVSRNQIVKYSKSLGSSPYIVNRDLYRNEIMQEISNNRMIYAGGYQIGTPKYRHAFVVYGYVKDKEYVYWNSWGYDNLRTAIHSCELKTGANSDKYYWDVSIRNFTGK